MPRHRQVPSIRCGHTLAGDFHLKVLEPAIGSFAFRRGGWGFPGRELMETGFTAEIPFVRHDTWRGGLWLVQAAKN